MPQASVIIPARDAEATLARTLACLERQAGAPDFEVIVVDDGSRDGTAEVARAAGATTLVQPRTGAAEARNRGVRAAGGEVLAFLDADCFPQPGWLAGGVRALETADIVQGHVRPDPAADLGPFDRTLWIVDDVGLWQTASLFVGRDVFDRAGGFEDWLDVGAGKLMAEDVWFGWRALRAGARGAFAAEALAHHAVFPRGPGGYISERRRAGHFPAIAARMPELRRSMFHRRLFLSRRTAAFDAAAVAVAVAAVRRSPAPLAAALPYVRLAWRERLKVAGPRAPEVAVVDLAADAVTLAALARGSLRARSLVL
ncbi:MAG TPA: glycosyltransferase family A protein [Thermoleophilaceae bacterium]|nr:glycosyltransferase family A protein [Thermoleophilaceae bacterium]